jgi:anti-sigma factor RsiW
VKDSVTCRELIEFLAEYLDGELSPDARNEFDRHLKVCASCVAYIDSYRQTIQLGKLAFAPTDEPAPVPEGLRRAIRAARGKPDASD